MSRLLKWEVWNFMSFKHAEVSFDDTNIINIKGYNDSGKSALIHALNVLFFDYKPQKQAKFINDDENYFRIVAYFSDGVTILRDKYSNGQGLYEMYKDDQLLYSTKEGSTLTRITEVPEKIAKYLNLVYTDEFNVNSRACFERQIGVQTTGSENYKFLNEVLQSESLYVAGASLNNDKNALGTRITSSYTELQTLQSVVGDGSNFSEEFLSALVKLDNRLDVAEVCESKLTKMIAYQNSIKEAESKVHPSIPLIDTGRLSAMDRILELNRGIILNDYMEEVPLLDTDRLSAVSRIVDLSVEVSTIKVFDLLDELDSDRLSAIQRIESLVTSMESMYDLELTQIDYERQKSIENLNSLYMKYKSVCDEISETDGRIETLLNERVSLMSQLGSDYVICPDCGSVHN